MTSGDRLIHRVAGCYCESVIVRVVRDVEGGPWRLAVAQGMGVSQERLEPCDVVRVSDGVWRLMVRERP